MADERRLRKRVNLSVYLAADNTLTGESMGKLVEINPSGFLLLTNSTYAAGMEYSVNLQLPEILDGIERVNCKARVIRAKKSANHDFNEVAFEIMYMSSAAKKIIEQVQEKWVLHFPEK
jgi:hypothetical protein